MGKKLNIQPDEPSKDVVTASPYTIREQRTLSLDTITPTPGAVCLSANVYLQSGVR